MAKIICPNAVITTVEMEDLSFFPDDRPVLICDKDCPTCHGAGYTEADVVEVEKVLAAWLDCHKEANSGTDVVMAFSSWIDSLKEAK